MARSCLRATAENAAALFGFVGSSGQYSKLIVFIKMTK